MIYSSFLKLAAASTTALVTGSTLILVLQLIKPAPACAQATLDLASLPACVAGGAWQSARDETLDITGRDLLGHHIGLAHAGDKWFPYSEYKETMCGELHQFKYYWDIDEDWAFNLIPYGRFDAMFQIAKEEGEAVCSGGKCVHTEINFDDDHFPKDDFFKIVHYSEDHFEDTDLIGTNMCVYGPWLADVGHEAKPEIHPAEFLWWRSGPYIFPGVTAYHVIMAQDDRNSFDRSSDFSMGCFQNGFFRIRDPATGFTIDIPKFECPPLPDYFRAWSKVPRLSEIRLAFEAKAGATQPEVFRIHERYAHKVFTGSDELAKRDQGPGTEYKIIFKGVPVVTVREHQPDDHLGVLFDDLCFSEADNNVRGFIVLTGKYGENDHGKEGFIVLDIYKGEFNPNLKVITDRLDQLNVTRTSAIQQQLAELRRALRYTRPPKVPPTFVLGGPPRRVDGVLVGDIKLGPDYDGATPYLPRQARLKVGRNSRQLKVQQGKIAPMPGSIVIRGVPVQQPGSVELEFESGTTRVGIPGLGISSEVGRDSSVNPKPAPEASRAFGSAVGVESVKGQLPGHLVWSSQHVVEMKPAYAPRIEDEVALEDQTSLTRSLNQALDSAGTSLGLAVLDSIFGTHQPFSLRWTFTGTNAQTGGTVPVEVVSTKRTSTRRSILVDTTVHSRLRYGFRVEFPTTGEIYLLKAHVQLRDIYGFSGATEHEVWSHYLMPGPDTTGTELLSAVARFAGQEPRQVVQLSKTDLSYGNDSSTSRLVAYARHARVSALRRASDGVITLPELRQLLEHVQKFYEGARLRK